jgi:hypothetical protein
MSYRFSILFLWLWNMLPYFEGRASGTSDVGKFVWRKDDICIYLPSFRLDDQFSIPEWCSGFSLRLYLQTSSEFHPHFNIEWLSAAVAWEKRPEREVNNYYIHIFRIRNAWSFTSTPPNVFIALKKRSNFRVTILAVALCTHFCKTQYPAVRACVCLTLSSVYTEMQIDGRMWNAGRAEE